MRAPHAGRFVWHPTEDYRETTNVARLMRTFGVTTADELRAASVADVGGFWDAVVSDLALPFRVPYSQVLDTSAGIERADWFVGGVLNVVDACLTQWARESPNTPAVVHESESGEVRTLTFAELEAQASRVRAGLRANGIGKGDAVALYLPMTPEAVVALYAVAGLGAMAVPLFSGFAPSAIAARLQDAGARAVITVDGTLRRGQVTPLRPHVLEALRTCPEVELLVTVDNLGNGDRGLTSAGTGPARYVRWDDLLAAAADDDVEATASSDVLLLAYTSGTTGRPKGAVHTHAGFLARVAAEVAYGFDITPGRTFCWITDMGWIMGPLSILGTHANGGTLLLYEGAPDVPDLGRIWQLAERHGVSMLGVSPTLIRTLRASRTGVPEADLSSVRIVGSTGEPWDPDSYEWLARDVLGGRVPIINFSGGTEVGGSFLSPYPVEDIASCSLGGPALGMDADVVDRQGQPVRGEIGELVCRQPWPSMTRGIWRDDARYLEAYWSTYQGLWHHGDHALVDEHGGWFVLGRSDDVLNVAGKRLAPAEVESVLQTDEAVRECAVVGVPDPAKGEAVWAFWVARPGAEDDADAGSRLRGLVAAQLGKPFAPSRVVRVEALPKTRSAKIMRRAVRAAVMGTDPGDLSGAENPDAVTRIRDQVEGLR